MKGKVYHIKLLFLFLFVASLGYEYWDPIGIRSSFTVTKFFGVLYTITAFTNIKDNFRISKANKPLVLSGLLLWLVIMLVTLFKSSTYYGEFSFVTSLIQVIILFWLVYNDIDQNPEIQPKIFLSFILGMFSVSVLLSLGIGMEASGGRVIDSLESSRVYFMGMNPNGMGALASLAILLIFILVFSVNFLGKWRIILLLLLPNLFILIGISGSRGAFFMVLLGLTVYFGLKKGPSIHKLFYLLFGIIAIYLLIDYLGDFERLQNRLTSTYETGDTGSRLTLWAAAYNIFAAHPFFGVGFNGLSIEMERSSTNSTAHNVFIDFALMGGVTGFILFTNFIRILFKRSWRVLQLNLDSGNLAILIVILFNLSKSGGGYDSKISWLMFATIAPIYLIKSKKYK